MTPIEQLHCVPIALCQASGNCQKKKNGKGSQEASFDLSILLVPGFLGQQQSWSGRDVARMSIIAVTHRPEQWETGAGLLLTK